MRLKSLTLIASIATVFALTGCGDNTPKCDDVVPDVNKLSKQVIIQNSFDSPDFIQELIDDCKKDHHIKQFTSEEQVYKICKDNYMHDVMAIYWAMQHDPKTIKEVSYEDGQRVCKASGWIKADI